MGHLNMVIRAVLNKKVTSAHILSIIFLSMFISPQSGQAFMPVLDCTALTSPLSIGMTNVSVRSIQLILNSDPRTVIASNGIGSSGNEGLYFGQKTKAAIIKFQELYKNDVLLPAGIAVGTGYIGPLTLAKLRTFCNGATTVISSTTSTSIFTVPRFQTINGSSSVNVPIASTTASISFPPRSLYVKFPATIGTGVKPRYYGPPGSRIRIYGLGFTATENTLYLGDAYTVSHLTSKDGSTIDCTLPLDVPRGKHDLWVSNTNGVSKTKSFFVVTDPKIPGPKIISFTPTSGPLGTEVTVIGSGFDSTNNEVHIGSGAIMHVPSPDGTTLHFRVDPPIPGLSAGQDVPGMNVQAKFWFVIVNDNGISYDGSTPTIFTLTI